MSPDSIDNGRRVAVDFGFYAGLAGMRVGDGVSEVAFHAEQPSQARITGTVDGRPVRLLNVGASDSTNGMLVVTFTFEDSAA